MTEKEIKQLDQLERTLTDFRLGFERWTGIMDERFRDYPEVRRQVEINRSDIRQVKTVYLTVLAALTIVSLVLSIWGNLH